jgi:RNA-directed DNA polymerase
VWRRPFVKLVIEPTLEQAFLPDSYGYRPGKSALDAIAVTRKRCWQHDWVLEFDIKGLFDNIPHALLLKAVRKHVHDKWALLYTERWLKAPMELEDGTQLERDRGTPQGGVVSPVLANLFMHYVFDAWMQREYPELPWCRYADDGLVHSRTLKEAEDLKLALQKRLAECGLEMHPDKTRIVFCKNGRRKGKYPNKSFDFLGYTFRPRSVITKEDNSVFDGFAPAVSRAALKAMRKKIRELDLRRRTQVELKDIARVLNIPFFADGPSITDATLPQPCIRYIATLTRCWWHGQCGSTKGSTDTKHRPAYGCETSQAASVRACFSTGHAVRLVRSPDRSRMTRECHVRFSESLG